VEFSMDDLGPQERAVLEAVTANPFAGQQEIANTVGLARSTVAAHIVQLMQKGYILGRGYVLPEAKRITCMGGATIDRKYYARNEVVLGTSNPAEGSRSFGGVARNVAENLARLGVATSLITILGDDESGRAIQRHMRDLAVDMSQVVVTGEKPTAEYAALLGPGSDLVLGIADMDILDLLTVSHVERIWSHLASTSWLFADCNLPGDVIATLIARKHSARFRLAVDAVSALKVTRLPQDLTGIDLLFLNRDEAEALLDPHSFTAPEEAALALQARGASEVILTLGSQGFVVATPDNVTRMRSVPANPIDVTGAGDGMIAGTLSRVLVGEPLSDAAQVGALLATITTESRATVHPDLSPRFLSERMHRIHREDEAVA
jgi:pseudouridine kinase